MFLVTMFLVAYLKSHPAMTSTDFGRRKRFTLPETWKCRAVPPPMKPEKLRGAVLKEETPRI